MTSGLIGKAPCQGDFVRLNATEPICHAFHRWLEEGNDALRQVPNAAVPKVTSFFFASRGERRALVGVMGPSQDKVGRQFPLAIVTVIDAVSAAAGFPGLPVTTAGFFEGAIAVLQDAPTLSGNDLARRVQSLPPLGPSELAAAQAETSRALSEKRARDLLALVDTGPDAPYYAMRTFLWACQTERGQSAPTRVTLDCPISSSMLATVWLELARRALGPAAPPSFFWTPDDPLPRLLIGLGAPSSATLLYLANRQHASAKLWPLSTQQAQATAAAKQALSSSARAAIENPDSALHEFLTAVAA
jgi:type VI secretion system protein ImpM